jgi:DNA polymerase/3'-5' exonuclease PolX
MICKMSSNKDIIIQKLTDLQKIYRSDSSKKWNLKALSSAIKEIEKYDKDIHSGEQLKTEIKGIGDKIAKRIDEILLTGGLKETELHNDSGDIDKLLDITGVGIVRAKKWVEAGIRSLNDVRQAILEKKIKSTHHIDIGIKYYDDFKLRIPRGEVDRMKEIIQTSLKKIDSKLVFEICGSYRRLCETCGDIDILVSHPSFIANIAEQKFLEKIVKSLKGNGFIVDYLTKDGNTKFMGVCKIVESPHYRRIDIRVVDFESFYPGLIYFTGNKNFNVMIRQKAIQMNMTLNEYGLFDNDTGDKRVFFSEKELLDYLKLDFCTPDKRNI